MKLSVWPYAALAVVCIIFGMVLQGTVLQDEPTPQEAPPGMVSVPLPDGRVLNVPEGSRVKIKVHSTPMVETVVQEDLGKVSSAGVKTTSDKIAERFQVESPELNLDGAGGRGGGATISSKLLASSGTNIFFITGAGLIVSGMIVLIWLKMKGLGLAMLAAGGVIIGVGILYERAPWILALGALAVLGVAAWAMYNLWTGKKGKEALVDVVVAIEKEAEVVAANGMEMKNSVVGRIKKAVAARAPTDDGHSEINKIVDRRDNP